MGGNVMQKINKFIADNGLWIFLGAAAYKFTFYIINLVLAFMSSAGYGVRSMFSGLLGAAWDLIVLAVILEVSRKVASGYPAEPAKPVQPAQPAQPAASPYTAPMPAQQPVQPVQQPAQPVQPEIPEKTKAIWTCPNCGSQNTEGMAFCAKCGNPR